MLQTALNVHKRGANYCADRPFWSKRWVPTSAASAKVTFIDLPIDQTVLPKTLDPDWRTRRKVVLLRRTTSMTRTRAVIIENGSVSTTLRPFNTDYFTMRIGLEKVQVALADFYHNWSQPELCLDQAGKPLILTQAQMGLHIACLGLPVTDI